MFRSRATRKAAIYNPKRNTLLAQMTVVLVLFSLFFTACSSADTRPVGEPLPAGEQLPAEVWAGVDVGTVGVKGETLVADLGANVTVLGAGEDIWSTEDSFHMAATQLDGDGYLATYVSEVQEIDAWTKAGVMMRSDLAPGSPNVFIHVTPNNGAVTQARPTPNADTIEPGYDHNLQPPLWLRLDRSGSQFTGSYSKDGISWQVLGQATVEMPEQVQIGLAVTSKDPTTPARAEFEHSRMGKANLGVKPPAPDPELDPEPDPQPSPILDRPDAPDPGGDRVTATYSVDRGIIPNPERGWYFERTSGEYAARAAEGYRLALRYVNLSSYRNTATIPNSVLEDVRRDLQRARDAGIKIIIRFAYNRSRDLDAPLNIVLGHIAQAGDLIRENSDVIAVVQAGFIGAWGEWHSSTNNLLTVENHTRISNALLDAVPSDRMIQLRKPQYLRELFPSESPIGASIDRAFDGSRQSRVGLMNDCFLTSSSDTGTFLTPDDYTMFANVGRFTVIGGETCDLAGLVPRNDCPTALAEMDKYHWDYLNHDFWRSIVERWRSNGCYDEITSRLGYRYELESASAPKDLIRGMSLDLQMTVRNTGFGKLYNPRPIEVLLVNSSTGQIITLEVARDARKVLPLSGETENIKFTTAIPEDTPTGSYFLYLKLPDGSSSLRGNSMYSIRLANTGVWDSGTGANDLSLWVDVR